MYAAWSAAGSAAMYAAGSAARSSAMSAAGDAAGDAAYLKVYQIICSDLKLDPKHIKHINDRWEVWKRGYSLLCDVGGVLYVYGVKK
jgi:hypothetical protein